MEVEYDYITGQPNVIFDNLKNAISAYKEKYNEVKIGISGRSPKRRLNQHLKTYNWQRMVVIYETSSIISENELENWVIDFHKDDLVNMRQGGGNHLPISGKNYLYVLLDSEK